MTTIAPFCGLCSQSLTVYSIDLLLARKGNQRRGSWATTGTIRVRTANQTGNDLRLDGFTANQTNVIRDGDWFSVGGRLYMAVEDRDSDGSGRVDDLLIAHQIYTGAG